MAKKKFENLRARVPTWPGFPFPEFFTILESVVEGWPPSPKHIVTPMYYPVEERGFLAFGPFSTIASSARCFLSSEEPGPPLAAF
jgi:hypothetical protein